MPRKADARLEGRILDAAYRIWSKRGEHALTMRAVALASGTTTPTLYARFSNKDDLLSLLRRRARLNFFSAIKPSRTPAQVCRRVLDFFAAHPNDFRLISEDWAIAFARKEHMPSFEFLKRHLAAQLGGELDQQTPVALASSRSCMAQLHFFFPWIRIRKSHATSGAPAFLPANP
jgi:AcrR family transcriptional regulator